MIQDDNCQQCITSFLPVSKFIFTALESFLKSQCEKDPNQNYKATMYFFSLGQDQINWIIDVKAL